MSHEVYDLKDDRRSFLNYSELQSVIADFANRQDLASQIPTFIKLTEARINRDVRHWRMTKRAEAQVTGERFPLPCDWVSTVQVKANGKPLRLADAFQVDSVDHAAQRAFVANHFYRHTGDELELVPASDGPVDFEIEYVAKVPSLSDEEPTNWVLEEFPDVYVYGAMLQVAPFLHDDQRLPLWTQAYGEAVSAANISSDRAKYSGSALRLQRHGLPTHDYRVY